MKNHLKLTAVSFRNEVATKHSKERSHRKNNHLKKGRFDEIINKMCTLCNIPKEVTIIRDAIELDA